MADFYFWLLNGYPIGSSLLYITLYVILNVVVIGSIMFGIVFLTIEKNIVNPTLGGASFIFATFCMTGALIYPMTEQKNALRKCEPFERNISEAEISKTFHFNLCHYREKKDGPFVKSELSVLK